MKRSKKTVWETLYMNDLGVQKQRTDEIIFLPCLNPEKRVRGPENSTLFRESTRARKSHFPSETPFDI